MRFRRSRRMRDLRDFFGDPLKGLEVNRIKAGYKLSRRSNRIDIYSEDNIVIELGEGYFHNVSINKEVRRVNNENDYISRRSRLAG